MEVTKRSFNVGLEATERRFNIGSEATRRRFNIVLECDSRCGCMFWKLRRLRFVLMLLLSSPSSWLSRHAPVEQKTPSTLRLEANEKASQCSFGSNRETFQYRHGSNKETFQYRFGIRLALRLLVLFGQLCLLQVYIVYSPQENRAVDTAAPFRCVLHPI